MQLIRKGEKNSMMISIDARIRQMKVLQFKKNLENERNKFLKLIKVSRKSMIINGSGLRLKFFLKGPE